MYRYWQRRQALTPGFHYSSPDAALTLLAERFEALLARRGAPCPPNRTWPEHLAAMPQEDEGDLRGFVRDYEQARFGPPPTKKDISRLDGALKKLEKKVETTA
jgi:hypothetical protein